MARSKKPRKAYVPKDFRAEAARLRAREVEVDKPSELPAAAHTAHRAPVARGRYVVPVAVGAGVLGGGAFLAHRARRRNPVAKALIDPLTGDAVVVEKRYIDDEFGKSAAKDAKYAFQMGRSGHAGAAAAQLGSRTKRLAFGAGGVSRQVTGDRALTGSVGVGVGASLPRKKVEKGFGSAARTAGRRARQAAGAPKRFAGGFMDTAAEGQIARGEHATQSGRQGAARRAGMVASATGGGTLLSYGGGHFVGTEKERERQSQRRSAAAQARRRKTLAARKSTVGKGVADRAPRAGCFVPGGVITNVGTIRANAEARPGPRSPAQKLTHVRTKVKHHPRGTLVQIRKGHTPVLKAAASMGRIYSETGRGTGRRLVNV